mgnify:CR=1 FL=1
MDLENILKLKERNNRRQLNNPLVNSDMRDIDIQSGFNSAKRKVVFEVK